MIDLADIKVFADGADLAAVSQLLDRHDIAGLTTNPTLMAAAGVTEYLAFAKELMDLAAPRPISYEVFSDEPLEIRRQAEVLAALGDAVYVKVPVVDSTGGSLLGVIRELSREGVQINVTAVFTRRQIDDAVEALAAGTPAIVSVFAGRIADAGVDPMPIVAHGHAQTQGSEHIEVLWASAREIFNLVQAVEAGAHIITLPYELLPKLGTLGRDLDQFSQETSAMFLGDARRSGYEL